MSKSGRLPRNTRDGEWISTVEGLGYVPPCVRDAFSWLPHPTSRTRKGEIVWFWMGHAGDERAPTLDAPAIRPPDSERCGACIFQEPPWSQGYAGCSHSWLRDDDGDCQAFVDRGEFLEQVHLSYREICKPPRLIESAHLVDLPYWRDGTRYSDFGPTVNLPSGYHARLNMPAWWANGAASVYGAIEWERLRRFWQWAERVTVEQVGAFQPDMFPGM